MKFFGQILFKKISATFLIALFVFIYAEKGFHTHDRTFNGSSHAGKIVIPKNTVCSLCEFQVTKNSDIPEVASIERPVYFLNTVYKFSVISYQSSSLEAISGRGPPFCG